MSQSWAHKLDALGFSKIIFQKKEEIDDKWQHVIFHVNVIIC
jgi:hypothetical protein